VFVIARLCENTVRGSTRLTTNGVVSLELSTYPFALSTVEGLRGSFQHSLAQRRTSVRMIPRTFVRALSCVYANLNYNQERC
jgi:hypothetical protein